jgi:hypothetical protein
VLELLEERHAGRFVCSELEVLDAIDAKTIDSKTIRGPIEKVDREDWLEYARSGSVPMLLPGSLHFSQDLRIRLARTLSQRSVAASFFPEI